MKNEWTAKVTMQPIDGVSGKPTDYMHKLVDYITFKLHHTFKKPHLQKIITKPGDTYAFLKVPATLEDLETFSLSLPLSKHEKLFVPRAPICETDENL